MVSYFSQLNGEGLAKSPFATHHVFWRYFYNQKKKFAPPRTFNLFFASCLSTLFGITLLNSSLFFFCNYWMICIYMFFLSSYTLSSIIGYWTFSFFNYLIMNIYRMNITQNASHDLMICYFNLFPIIHTIKCPT